MKKRNAVDPILAQTLRDVGCPMPEDGEDDSLPGLTIVVSRPEITRAYVMRGWGTLSLCGSRTSPLTAWRCGSSSVTSLGLHD